MQGKILVFSLVLSLIILNVLAQGVDDESDDVDFDAYQANLLNAVDIIEKNLKTRDARSLQRRGWLKNVWNNFVKPVLVSTAVKVLAGAIIGRSVDDNAAFEAEARDVKETQCGRDAAKFKEVKKAALQLCGLARFPDVKCY